MWEDLFFLDFIVIYQLRLVRIKSELIFWKFIRFL